MKSVINRANVSDPPYTQSINTPKRACLQLCRGQDLSPGSVLNGSWRARLESEIRALIGFIFIRYDKRSLDVNSQFIF